MTEKENKSEAKEEKGGKAVAVQRGALAPFKSFEDRFEQSDPSNANGLNWLSFERRRSI
jgi:hypothetical protein